ncbi:MAG: NAD(P)-dependent glycerol-3-phosphate dehydrogenase [Gammaproteobacteria bacterium]|nr:NAD(P)-dependent glycerol-3-phosphate dehydrogenase [Gammaproteobacteria bacterium]
MVDAPGGDDSGSIALERPIATVAVLGAGSWGTALAMLLARNGLTTLLWGRNPAELQQMAQQRCNHRFLPGLSFPEGLQIAPALDAALQQADLVLLAVPSHGFRELAEQVVPGLRPGQRLLWATKGLDLRSGQPLHTIITALCPKAVPYAVISGPTFAAEVARGLPTAVTVAATDAGYARMLAAAFSNDRFRVYTSSDIVGVELGGSVKNVLAIAAGIADGQGFGANTRAALVTRGLYEMMSLGLACGGLRETFMGLTGLGDLVLTCTDDQSRNRRFGLALGRGVAVAEARRQIDQVIEGIETTEAIHRLARHHHVEMPIVEQVYHVLFEGRELKTAVSSLFGRGLKAEDAPL